MTSPEPISEAVRRLRTQAGMSQAALSEATGGTVSSSLIAQVETGRRLPSADSLREICLALGLTEKQARALEEARRAERGGNQESLTERLDRLEAQMERVLKFLEDRGARRSG